MRRRVATGALLLLPALGVVAAPAANADTTLTGTFTIDAGSCGSGVTGSYFRMILHSGSPSGPFLSNSDSTCRNHTYTLLSAGRDGGLVTGRYQEQASPPFDGSGNAVTDRITKPARFYGVDFATATNRVDPQTGTAVTTPRVSVHGSTVSADLRAFAVSWNKQQFNQGSPKPNGSMPGNTRPVTGSYDAATGAYTLQWTSQIQGGPFDGFTGLWHLTGRFIPATATPTQQPSPTGTARGGSTGGGATTSPTPAPATSSQPRGHPRVVAAGTASSSATRSASSNEVITGATSSATPAPAASGGSSGTTAGGARSDHGSTRWPWVLVAFLAVAVAGLGVVRTATGARR